MLQLPSACGCKTIWKTLISRRTRNQTFLLSISKVATSREVYLADENVKVASNFSSRMTNAHHCIPLLTMKNLRKLLELIDRGGLAEPTEYCFVICCLATRTYEKIISCEVTKKQLITCSNQKKVFVDGICSFAESSEEYKAVLSQSCSRLHNNFKLILQTAFNCFAKNELKRLNKCVIEVPAKMTRTVRKLTAKSSAK